MARECLTFVYVIVSCFSFVISKDPCHYHMSVNITGATKLESGRYIHDDIVYPGNHTFQYTDEDNSTHLRGCLCLLKNCIRKCCPVGQLYNKNKECIDSSDPHVNPFNPPVYSVVDHLDQLNAHKHFGLVFGDPCEDDRYMLNPYTGSTGEDDAFYIQPDGGLLIPNTSLSDSKTHHQMEYCIDAWEYDPGEHPDGTWTTKYLALICFVEEYIEEDEQNGILASVYAIGMIISIPFLVATFLVYALIPELQNLHGKALMSYVSGLTVAYTFLATIQILSRDNEYSITDALCFSFAFIIYFSFMLSFFWLNVMCFDIWWTFRGFRARNSGRRASEKRRFIYYSLYAWGFPMILTGICALMEFHPSIPNTHIKPMFGMKKCWFPDWKTELIYFYLPVILLVVANLFLFASTAYKILQAKRDTAVLCAGSNSRHSQYEKDKQRFNLYCKLFLVMGINWVAEWASFTIGGSQYLWIVTDLCNTLHGIFIFVIFVWKRKVKILIIKRYHLLRYGSTASNARSSSRFRSTNSGFVTNETEKSFMSQSEDNNITLKDLSYGKTGV